MNSSVFVMADIAIEIPLSGTQRNFNCFQSRWDTPPASCAACDHLDAYRASRQARSGEWPHAIRACRPSLWLTPAATPLSIPFSVLAPFRGCPHPAAAGPLGPHPRSICPRAIYPACLALERRCVLQFLLPDSSFPLAISNHAPHTVFGSSRSGCRTQVHSLQAVV